MAKSSKAKAAGQNEAGIDIGLNEAARKKAAGIMTAVLADTFATYLKTHNYHWNVTGPFFQSLHSLFDGQYNELHDAIDGIAERIRALGEKAPGSLAAFAKLTSVSEPIAGATADEMVRDLAAANEALVRSLRKAEAELGELGDVASADLLVGRIEASEKHAWMLRSSIG
ncbi:Dps family protein [Zavarzinia sp.]|uniref:Dps family protein n=1 Tax=Zavarzinia sp. TaxID=2027920 RepID=UPI003564D562